MLDIRGLPPKQSGVLDRVLTLPSAAVPAAPDAGNLALYAANTGSRQMLAQRGPAGVGVALQPHLGFNALSAWQPNVNSTTVALIRAVALLTIGTITAAAAAATNRHTRMQRVEHLVTVASTTAIAGFRCNQVQWTVGAAAAGDGGFQMVMRWGPATGVATATNRAFAGMGINNTPTDVEPSSLVNQIGMGWDAADTNIQIMHNDASGACTKIDLGASFPVPTVDRTSVYEIVLTALPGTTQQCDYQVTDLNSGATASGTVTTNLPATTLFMGPRAYMSVGGTSSVIGIALMGITVESDYG